MRVGARMLSYYDQQEYYIVSQEERRRRRGRRKKGLLGSGHRAFITKLGITQGLGKDPRITTRHINSEIVIAV